MHLLSLRMCSIDDMAIWSPQIAWSFPHYFSWSCGHLAMLLCLWNGEYKIDHISAECRLVKQSHSEIEHLKLGDSINICYLQFSICILLFFHERFIENLNFPWSFYCRRSTLIIILFPSSLYLLCIPEFSDIFQEKKDKCCYRKIV